MKVIYRASDGEEFETRHECERHEESLERREGLGVLLVLACVAAIFFFL